jgi:hypothetical protein
MEEPMISRGVTILAALLLLTAGVSSADAQPRDWGGRGFAGRGWGGRGFGQGGGWGGRGFAPRGGGGGYGGGPGFGPERGGWGQPPGAAYGPPPAWRGRAPNSLDSGWRDQQDEVRRAVREGRHVPLGAAIDAVRRRAPGRELDAGLEPGPGGRPVYRLRWAGQNGRRTDYMVDATTGRILGPAGP